MRSHEWTSDEWRAHLRQGGFAIAVIHQPSCAGYHDCGGVFRCADCLRFVGWCFGAADEHPALCDDCAVKQGSSA